MGTYNLPRDVKGEGRILFIFTGKSMLYTAIGATVGFVLFYLPLSALGMTMVGISCSSSICTYRLFNRHNENA